MSENSLRRQARLAAERAKHWPKWMKRLARAPQSKEVRHPVTGDQTLYFEGQPVLLDDESGEFYVEADPEVDARDARVYCPHCKEPLVVSHLGESHAWDASVQSEQGGAGARALREALEKVVDWLERLARDATVKGDEMDAPVVFARITAVELDSIESFVSEAREALTTALEGEEVGARTCGTCGSDDPEIHKLSNAFESSADYPADKLCPDPFHHPVQTGEAGK